MKKVWTVREIVTLILVCAFVLMALFQAWTEKKIPAEYAGIVGIIVTFHFTSKMRGEAIAQARAEKQGGSES